MTRLDDGSLMAAAMTAVNVPLRYARQNTHLAVAAMAGARQGIHLAHYPDNDVVDHVHHTRFYYHCHRSPRLEHGHFHIFVNDREPGSFMHLAALSLSVRGEPLRWFTTNAWVTGERLPASGNVIALLDTFQVQARGRLAPVASWLTAMVQLFKPQLAHLLLRRDALMQRWCQSRDWAAVCDDRALDVISQCSAALPRRIQQFQQRGY
ncbi:hypothetical protein HUU62_24435 [Rhodoferax sp. 4810]|nr:hypothetical protein [Rhodoferax jenense]